METGTPGPPPGEAPEPAPPPAPEAPVPPAGAAVAPMGQAPRVRPGAGPPSAPYTAVLEFDREDEYSRLLPFVKWLLLIPHWIALTFVGLAAFFAIVVSWFAVLFTGRYPQGLHGFVTGTYRWAARVSAYMLLMTDRYPPFSLDHDDDYPARLDIAYEPEIARWRPLVHWLLVIPYMFVAGVLLTIAYFVTIAAFFTILFTKQFPQAMFDFNVVALRWQARANIYSYWMTERYPPWQWA
jgi:hypothetical protein